MQLVTTPLLLFDNHSNETILQILKLLLFSRWQLEVERHLPSENTSQTLLVSEIDSIVDTILKNLLDSTFLSSPTVSMGSISFEMISYMGNLEIPQNLIFSQKILSRISTSKHFTPKQTTSRIWMRHILLRMKEMKTKHSPNKMEE